MNDKMLGMVWHCVSLAHLLSFLGADNMSELEPEDGVVTGAAERMLLGEGGWKIVPKLACPETTTSCTLGCS